MRPTTTGNKHPSLGREAVNADDKRAGLLIGIPKTAVGGDGTDEENGKDANDDDNEDAANRGRLQVFHRTIFAL